MASLRSFVPMYCLLFALGAAILSLYVSVVIYCFRVYCHLLFPLNDAQNSRSRCF